MKHLTLKVSIILALRLRQTANVGFSLSWEFLKIENKWIKTVQDDTNG